MGDYMKWFECYDGMHNLVTNMNQYDAGATIYIRGVAPQGDGAVYIDFSNGRYSVSNCVETGSTTWEFVIDGQSRSEVMYYATIPDAPLSMNEPIWIHVVMHKNNGERITLGASCINVICSNVICCE